VLHGCLPGKPGGTTNDRVSLTTVIFITPSAAVVVDIDGEAFTCIHSTNFTSCVPSISPLYTEQEN